MAPYARYVPLKPTAPVAAATETPEHVSIPPKAKQVKVPKGPSRSDDSGRKKRKRAELEDAPTAVTGPAAADDKDTLAIPSKHSAVYSKFQKAAQRSEAAKATAPDDNVDPADQPELHGMRQPCLALGCADKTDRTV
jgi:ATP-dependent RNA helicase DDX51/DBP6